MFSNNVSIVSANTWNCVIKLKTASCFNILYYPKDKKFSHYCLGALQSIWTEEYANPIELYNEKQMCMILYQIYKEVNCCDNILEKIIFTNNPYDEIKNITQYILRLLIDSIILLQVRDSNGFEATKDKYIIEQSHLLKKDSELYTIEQFDKIFNEKYKELLQKGEKNIENL